jgi:hypothetical protein
LCRIRDDERRGGTCLFVAVVPHPGLRVREGAGGRQRLGETMSEHAEIVVGPPGERRATRPAGWIPQGRPRGEQIAEGMEAADLREEAAQGRLVHPAAVVGFDEP